MKACKICQRPLVDLDSDFCRFCFGGNAELQPILVFGGPQRDPRDAELERLRAELTDAQQARVKLRDELVASADYYDRMHKNVCDERDRLRSALIGLRWRPDGCWCDISAGDPRLSGHTTACDAARAALAGGGAP
jgi:hypothetical protein